jgi:hypothetical protein
MTTTAQITSEALAAESCVHRHGEFDTNRDWPCQRAAMIYSRVVWAQNIEATAKRAERSRGRREVNLRRYVTDESARLAKMVAEYPLPVCSAE